VLRALPRRVAGDRHLFDGGPDQEQQLIIYVNDQRVAGCVNYHEEVCEEDPERVLLGEAERHGHGDHGSGGHRLEHAQDEVPPEPAPATPTRAPSVVSCHWRASVRRAPPIAAFALVNADEVSNSQVAARLQFSCRNVFVWRVRVFLERERVAFY
jgi:hypothetical protein